ncbi:hypothetical protein HK101_003194 [Irineochytrium annulatum]|nr:hypothetical protein HK101_003194 [Irineochytrium annulatum]
MAKYGARQALPTTNDSKDASHVAVAYQLDQSCLDAATIVKWPHPFTLTYTVTMTVSPVKTLRTHLKVDNTGPNSFDFASLLHTYFGVDDIADVKVQGLAGGKYVDKVRNAQAFVEDQEEVVFTGEVDRVYENPTLKAVAIMEGGRMTANVVYEGFNDVVVWNPWIEKAAGMADFPDDGYKKMVCVEVGQVAQNVTLPPGGSWEGSQLIKV